MSRSGIIQRPDQNARSCLAGTAVFFTALTARASLVTTARFLGDQALFFETLLGIRQGTAHPVLGPALSGGHAHIPGSAFYYLLSMSQWISPTPECANLASSFLCALGVFFFWAGLRLEFKNKWGELACFIPALLLSLSPWSVLFGESLDSGYILNFFAGLGFWLTTKIRNQPDSSWIALFVLTCALMPQFHLSAPIVWAGFGALLWPKRKQIRWRWVMAGGLASLGLYIPYLISEIQSGWSNYHAYILDSSLSGHVFHAWKVPVYLFKFLTVDTSYQELHGYWGGMSEGSAISAALFGTSGRPFSMLRLLVLILSWIFAFQVIRQAILKRHELGNIFTALLWGATLNLALLFFTGRYFYPHYTQPLILFVYACIPAWVVWAQSLPLWKKRAQYGLLCVLTAGSIEAAQSVSRHIDARIGISAGRQVIETILKDADSEKWPENSTVQIQEVGVPMLAKFYQPLMTGVYHRSFRLVDEEGVAVARYEVRVTEFSPAIKITRHLF